MLETQAKVIGIVKPGIETVSLDKIASEFISEAGYGEYIMHRISHGIGLGGCEFDLQKDKFKLASGMVFTVEPAIYIRGFGGVRIEDDILVTKTGAERLTRTSAEQNVI